MKLIKRFVLGKGSFGIVSLATPVDCSVAVAVKTAVVEFSSTLVAEGRVLHNLRGCPEIISCFGEDVSMENGQEVYNLLLEYAPRGTLDGLLKHGSPLTESLAGYYAYMILKGLSHIHRRGYVHCDLKPANILVFPSEIDPRLNHLKIADFGLAKKSGPERRRVIKKLSDNMRGTAAYNSPESVRLGQHEAPMDIWALGIIMIKMLTGRSASLKCEDKEVLLHQIAFWEEFPEVPYFVSLEACQFMQLCLSRDPEARPTADMLLCHPFIVNNKYRAIYDAQMPEKLSINNSLQEGDKWYSGRSLFSTPVSPKPNLFSYLPHHIFERYRLSQPHLSRATGQTKTGQYRVLQHV